jgi:cytoskeleton protein RodZ
MPQAELSPESLGAHLRSLREAKGSSLEDMARSTRVGIRHLEALEEERLADLPSPVFVRGFLRAYCGFLRESPETALARYQRLLGERAATVEVRASPGRRSTRLNNTMVVGLVLLVVLGLGLVTVNLIVKKSGGTFVAAAKSEPPVADPPIAAAVPPRAAGSPVAGLTPATSAPQASAISEKPVPSAQRLVVKAVEETWIRVQTDEGKVAEELLPPGASREWAAERRFLLTIGNAGGVELTLNGKPLPPLGAKGAVIHRLELPPPPASGS